MWHVTGYRWQLTTDFFQIYIIWTFLPLVLLYALYVERFSVSCMWEFSFFPFFHWCAGGREVNGLERFINTSQNTNKGAIERPQIWVFYEIVSYIGWKIAANTFFCVVLMLVILQHFSILRVFGASLLWATLLWIMGELAGERYASLTPSLPPKTDICFTFPPSIYIYSFRTPTPQQNFGKPF